MDGLESEPGREVSPGTGRGRASGWSHHLARAPRSVMRAAAAVLLVPSSVLGLGARGRVRCSTTQRPGCGCSLQRGDVKFVRGTCGPCAMHHQVLAAADRCIAVSGLAPTHSFTPRKRCLSQGMPGRPSKVFSLLQLSARTAGLH